MVPHAPGWQVLHRVCQYSTVRIRFELGPRTKSEEDSFDGSASAAELNALGLLTSPPHTPSALSVIGYSRDIDNVCVPGVSCVFFSQLCFC